MIFVGIVTCNRLDFFKKCYNSVKDCSDVDYICVVNDGDQKVDSNLLNKKTKLIEHSTNKGVGISKNELFKYALTIPEIQHIFIVEDDIVVKNCEVFKRYIEAKDLTGIHHFMFGYHGPANKNGYSGGPPKPRYVIEYNKDFKLAINLHSVGAFCYYSREVLEGVGLIDEQFINAFDHVDHDYRISKANYCTPYWNWPDLANSVDYLEEIECSEKSSAIKPRKDWEINIRKGAELFAKKHKYLPAWNNSVPDVTKNDLIKILKQLKTKNENSITTTHKRETQQ
jgi:GT2 family glycosyltransferase